MFAVFKMKLSGKTVYGPVLKTTQLSAHAQNHATVLRAAVLTQYRRVTDGRTDRQTDRRTDGIAVANTALAMRALRAL